MDTSTAIANSTVFLAAADVALRTLLASALRADGFRVVTHSGTDELLEALQWARLGSDPTPLLVVADIDQGGGTKLNALNSELRARSNAALIVLTSLGDDELRAQASALDVAAVFNKPCDIDELLVGVRAHLPVAL